MFDTTFHATLAPEAYMYALPYELYETRRIRRQVSRGQQGDGEGTAAPLGGLVLPVNPLGGLVLPVNPSGGLVLPVKPYIQCSYLYYQYYY